MPRKSYTLKEKLETLQRLQQLEGNISATAREKGITPKMLRDWKESESKYIMASGKDAKRHIGSGRTALYPATEEKLYEWVVHNRTTDKRIITYKILKNKALEIAKELGDDNLVASSRWAELFMKRHKLSTRKITSVGQEDSRPKSEKKKIINEYFEELRYKLNKLSNEHMVINMDETPVYVDMMATRTISFTGEKNTEAHSTGHNKTRLTVVLAITASGKFLKTMVILKNLKNVPKCEVPQDIIVTCNKSGTMNTEIMHKWIDSCHNISGPFKNRDQRLLIMDSFSTHKESSILEHIARENTETILIPPKMTALLQPLDVLVNASFKAHLKQKWNDWSINGPIEYTKGGNRKRPEWEWIFKAISDSVKEIDVSTCKKSFMMCGISGLTINLNETVLSEKLKYILNDEEDEQLVEIVDDLDGDEGDEEILE